MPRAAAEKLVQRLCGSLPQSGQAADRMAQTPEQLKEMGSEHFQAGRLSTAGSYYRSAITARPHYAEAHNNLGAVLRKRGKSLSAIAAFQSALMLNPRSASTYGNLANLHERYGNIAQAETYYLKAVELNSQLYQAFIGLARISTRRQRWDDALAALTRAAAIAPQSVEILYQTGVVNLYKGDLAVAFNTLRNAEGLAPKNPDIKASLAEVLFRLDRTQLAEEALEQCFAIDPENALGKGVRDKDRSAQDSAAPASP